MSRDYGELEREFIDGLCLDSGRDLAQWMALIDSQTFAHRNDMIDWLRQMGLTFAKASRLERIHHNGGRPLYGEKPAAKPHAEVAVAPAAKPIPAAPPAVKPPPPVATPRTPAPVPPTAPPIAATPAADLASFLAKAKGYRPLAELLIRNIRATVPATAIVVHDTHIDLGARTVFAALAVTSKDIRLSLALGDHPFEGELKRLHLPGAGPALTHTVVISDARRVDANLMALVVRAAKTVNS